MASSIEDPATATPRRAAAGVFGSRWLVLLVQLVVIGASLVALWYWLPDTIDSWNEKRASDFPNFNGAPLLVREGLGDRLYDRSPTRDEELREFCQIPEELADAALTFTGPNDACRSLEGNFRSPPSIILVYFPGTFLSGDDAYHLTFIVIALASVALATWTAAHFESWTTRLAVFLAILALPVLQLGLRLSQPSVIYALALLAGFKFESRKMPVPAAICFAVLSLKPQFLVLPLAYLVYRRSFTTAVWTAAFSLAALAIGAAMVGPTAMANYVELNVDLAIDGPHLLQQAWMYNWQGFALALAGEPQRTAATLLSIATLLLLAVACLRRPRGSAALVIASSLLIAPYALFYDWVILCAAAALAAVYLGLTEARGWLGVLMLIVWAGLWATHDSVPIFGSQSGSLPEGVVYWSTVSLAVAMIGGAILFERLGPADDQGHAGNDLTSPADVEH